MQTLLPETGDKTAYCSSATFTQNVQKNIAFFMLSEKYVSEWGNDKEEEGVMKEEKKERKLHNT